MATWKSAIMKEENIIYRTERSVLIKMPDGSSYKGFKFWHPKKLVEYMCGDCYIRFSDEFVFKLFKNGNGRFNRREIVDQKEVSWRIIEEVMEHDYYRILDPYETHVPEHLEPEKAEVLEELLDV